MVAVPQSYLAPASQPWGRAIESNLAAVERDVRIKASDTDNALRGMTANVNLLTQQQLELAVAQESLEAAQASLAAQQAILAGTKTRYSGSDGTTQYGYTLNAAGGAETLLYTKDFPVNLTLANTQLFITATAQTLLNLSRNAVSGNRVSTYYWVSSNIYWINNTTGVTSSKYPMGYWRHSVQSPTGQSASMEAETDTIFGTFGIGLPAGNYTFKIEYLYYLGADWGSIQLSKVATTAVLSDGSV